MVTFSLSQSIYEFAKSHAIHLPKGVPIFQLFLKRIFRFLNLSIMLNICKFQEYLGNSRKPISQNKEFKFCHLQNFIKEKTLSA